MKKELPRQLHAPDVFSDHLNKIEPYILAVTGLTLDTSRVKAVTEWFGLDKIANDVGVVNIEYRILNRQSEEELHSGEFIYIHVNGQWKLYETQ